MIRCTYETSAGPVTAHVTWRLIYPDCRRPNILCQAGNPAYLPAVTVCRQRLWHQAPAPLVPAPTPTAEEV